MTGRSTVVRPNIVVILCDDLGYGDVGALSWRHRSSDRPSIRTPHLDELAASGMTLHGMYCPAPVCAPSRASLLTGTSQGQCHLRDNDFDGALEDGPNLASVLQHAGYHTAAVGKWGLPGHLPPDVEAGPATWPAFPTRRGFEEFFGYARHTDGHEHYPKEGLYRGPKQVWHNDREVSADLDRCYTTDLFTAFAKDWIVRTSDSDKPFFLYLALDTPHAVQELPTGPYPEGGGLRGGVQWLGKSGRMINTAQGRPDSWVHPEHVEAVVPNTNEPWPDVYRRYGTAVRRIDDCVGDVRQLLSDLRLADDTLLLFTSDNGPSIESYLPEALEADFFRSYGPFDGIKRDCWEGGVRVGALASWPSQITAGAESSAPMQFHDVLPTFAELAGVPAPARTDGVSILPTLTGCRPQVPSRIYVEYSVTGETPEYADFASGRRGRPRGQMQMLRLGDLVGVRFDIKDAADRFEIYEVVADPGQRRDLGSSAALQERFMVAATRRRTVHPSVPRPYDGEFMRALSPDELVPATALTAFDHPLLAGTPWVPDPETMRLPACDLDGHPSGGVSMVRVQSGVVDIAADGFYVFEIDASEAVLKLHDAVVMDSATGLAARVGLATGRHPYRLIARSSTAPLLAVHRACGSAYSLGLAPDDSVRPTG